MWKELKPGFMMMVVMTALTGFIYPGVVTILAQMLFRDQANGSLVVRRWPGRRLPPHRPALHQARVPSPTAIGARAATGYDPTASGGSNLGPTSAKLINGTTRIDDERQRGR